jgi:acyl-CoA thioesterase FadM
MCNAVACLAESWKIESARIAYFDLLVERIKLDEMKEGHLPSLASQTINYRRQLKFPAAIDIGIRCKSIGRSSWAMEQCIVQRADAAEANQEVLVADASSVVVWCDYNIGKSTPLPDSIRAAIEELEGVKFPLTR